MLKLRLPMFGLIKEQDPMTGLLEHYEQIAKGMHLIEESMECYIAGGICKDFTVLLDEVDEAENHGDKIKRNIRNHLPRSLFMPVDKTLFFHYTRSQDNILDAGQEALHWLAMRRMAIPEVFQREYIFYLYKVAKTVELLKPALESTISLVLGDESGEREEIKNTYRAVRAQHREVVKDKGKIISMVYQSDMDFKDIYQLMHFADELCEMSHNAESCADILRAMISR